MRLKRVAHFEDTDPRYLPTTYTLSEASHYLLLPRATLRSWVIGRSYPVGEGKGFFKPPILVGEKNPIMLCFVNLIEAHVLDAVRREFHVTFPKVRSAINYLRREFQSDHPLAEQKIETDGRDLFIRSFGKLIAASKGGQLAMPELIGCYLRRIDWDPRFGTAPVSK